MNPRIISLEDSKGYATEANLLKGLDRLGLRDWDLARSIIIARKPDGKWTAIFVIDPSKGGYIAAASAEGFMTV